MRGFIDDMKKTYNIKGLLEDGGGFITAKEMGRGGYYRAMLDEVRQGNVVRVSAGVYALDDALANTMVDLEKVVPGGILCGYSAWEHYGLTTQVPPAICVAIERDRKIVLPYFPIIRLYRIKGDILWLGVTTDEVGGYVVPIYDIERSVCDAVKARNKIGVGVCAEIVRTYLSRPNRDIPKLMEYAKTLRVATTLTRYLEIEL